MTKILVIDDERSIRNSMKDILQYEGHEIVLAENGMEGLFRRHPGYHDIGTRNDRHGNRGH